MVLSGDERKLAVERMKKRVQEIKDRQAQPTETPEEALQVEEGESEQE